MVLRFNPAQLASCRAFLFPLDLDDLLWEFLRQSPRLTAVSANKLKVNSQRPESPVSFHALRRFMAIGKALGRICKHTKAHDLAI